MHIAILGRQPKIGLAELESVLGAQAIAPFSASSAILAALPDITRLGGTLRIAKVLEKRHGQWFDDASGVIASDLTSSDITGKRHVGLSVIDADVSVKKVHAKLLELKKSLRSQNRSVRVILGKQPELNAAEVRNNQLLRKPHAEYVYVQSDREAILAKTVTIQDIDAYAARDHARPARDPRVGMLPPKLAQIMLNLAVGQFDNQRLKIKDPTFPGSKLLVPTILDPFCGTGVILQEALLMGFTALGSDIDPRMIDYSRTNLKWLSEQSGRVLPDWSLQPGDARTHAWPQPVGAVVSETYLGRPLNNEPGSDELRVMSEEIRKLLKDFLGNLAGQIESGTPVVLAVPAWRSGGRFVPAPSVDYTSDMGYTPQDFRHAAPEDMLYYRADQIVARKLLVLKRK